MPEGVLSFTQSKPEELTKQVAKIKNEANNYSRNNGVALIDQKTGAGIASRYSGVDLSSGFLQKINLDSSSGQTFNYAPEHVDYVNTEKKYFYDIEKFIKQAIKYFDNDDYDTQDKLLLNNWENFLRLLFDFYVQKNTNEEPHNKLFLFQNELFLASKTRI